METDRWHTTVALPTELRSVLACYRIGLEAGPDLLLEARQLLSSDELARADRYLVETAQCRFVLARAALRTLLAEHLNVSPEGVRFGYMPQGKPYLTSPQAPPGFSFSVAHSGELALIALSSAHQVGVDLEGVVQRPDLNEIAKRFFAPGERDLLAQTPAPGQLRLFYRLWTCKEAVLKADGRGITSGLEEPDLSGLDRVQVGDLGHRVTLRGSVWRVSEVYPEAGYQAALAVAEKTGPTGF